MAALQTTNNMLPCTCHSCRTLSAERQAWWCADVAHLLYSAVASLAALMYVLRQPRALQLSNQPEDITAPSIIVCASAGKQAVGQGAL